MSSTSGQDIITAVRVVRRFCEDVGRLLKTAKELMERRAPAAEVQAAVKLPPWKMGDFNAHVRHTPVDEITRGLRRMAEVDLAIKSSVGTPELQLEVLVCELTL